MTLDLGIVVQAIIGALVTAIWYFIKKTTDRLEDDVRKVQSAETTLALLGARLDNVESNLTGRIAILERNLETAFKKIDECKGRKRT